MKVFSTALVLCLCLGCSKKEIVEKVRPKQSSKMQAKDVVPVKPKDLAQTGTRPSAFGLSVAADGNTVAIGSGNLESGDYAENEVAVFEKIDGKWNKAISLKPTAPFSFRKAHIALSGDTILVNARYAGLQCENFIRGVHVFKRREGKWENTALIRSTEFGAAISISEDRFVIAKSVPSNDPLPCMDDDCNVCSNYDDGAIVFEEDGDNWVEEVRLALPAKISPCPNQCVNNKGKCEECTEDNGPFWGAEDVLYNVLIRGETIILSEYVNPVKYHVATASAENGRVAKYQLQKKNWVKTRLLGLPSSDPGDRLGVSLAYANDTIIAGADVPSDFGFVLSKTGKNPNQILTIKPGEEPENNFGSTVALYKDILAVGPKLRIYNRKKGGRWIFQFPIDAEVASVTLFEHGILAASPYKYQCRGKENCDGAGQVSLYDFEGKLKETFTP